jgi:hypothetical protein
MEGMPTPSGTLDNYGFEPRAVMTVGRSIHEVSDGVYTTTVMAPPSEDYEFVLLLENPRMLNCFEFAVQPQVGEARVEGPVEFEIAPVVDGSSVFASRESVELAFRLSEKATEIDRPAIEDLRVLLMSPTGWQQRLAAAPRADGSYAFDVNVPVSGLIYMFVASNSEGVEFDGQRPTTLMFQRSPPR